MAEKVKYRAVSNEEIKVLEEQGCSAVDWKQVEVAELFKAVRVRNTHFGGKVKIGQLAGNVKSGEGVQKISGIFNAYLVNCTIGDNVRIANIGVHIANYNIGDGVCIENVGTMETTAGATFGNGVEVEVLNEGGGREVVLFDELWSQFAYIQCLHRYRAGMIDKLNGMAKDYVEKVRSDYGTIGEGARICSVSEMVNVKVGAYAVVNCAKMLNNGTILSSAEAVTVVGHNVEADDFIIAEGSTVSGGVIVSKSFIGQGCQIGKQFSMEGSLFFANCEGFHGEACSVFGGPYTVTHHKSSLLIAGLFSFYNAGSGTNQSNHMYKLGPVHEGKIERGTKTGSFSYMMWPCKVGPFSVVLGKHSGTFDTSDYPFSHLEARSDGKALMVPGLSLSTVGRVRDGLKWPKRDRRKGRVKRDIICFDVLSPYTVGKMIKASEVLGELSKNTDKSIEEVTIGGTQVRRVLLRTSMKFYKAGIEAYLLEKVIEKTERGLAEGITEASKLFAVDADADYSEVWVDISGQLMGKERLKEIEEGIEAGTIKDIASVQEAFAAVYKAYDKDEWAWVKKAFAKVFGSELDKADKEELVKIADMYLKAQSKLLKQVINDATKEFDTMSQMGFGQDGSEAEAAEDFRQVRGVFEENGFVKDMKGNLAALEKQVEAFQLKIKKLKKKEFAKEDTENTEKEEGIKIIKLRRT